MSFANSIIEGNLQRVEQYLTAGADINEFDEYGFTPLIESAIANHQEIASTLLKAGADPNIKDLVGGTALHWAVENSNIDLCRLLLENGADVNAHNMSAEPILVKPILREDKELKQLLYQHGAQSRFANDYIHFKLLGHRYDLRGEVDIITANGEFTELCFEGFFLESTLLLVRHSLQQYIKNYATREKQDFLPLYQPIINALWRAGELFKFQHYQTDVRQHQTEINQLLDHELRIIPVNYEGHAIAFLNWRNIWVHIDRRKEEQLLNGITYYHINDMSGLTNDFLKFIIYEKKNKDFIDEGISKHLKLSLAGRLLLPPQVSGNCSWASISACIPAALYLITNRIDQAEQVFLETNPDIMTQYQHWQDWDKNMALDYCLRQFKSANRARQASIAAVLTAVLFQRFSQHDQAGLDRARDIAKLILNSKFSYLIDHYLEYYYLRQKTEAGKNFKALLDNIEAHY